MAKNTTGMPINKLHYNKIIEKQMFKVGMLPASKVRNSMIRLLVQLLCQFIRPLFRISSPHVERLSSSWESCLICCASWMGYTELAAISSLYGSRSCYPLKFMM